MRAVVRAIKYGTAAMAAAAVLALFWSGVAVVVHALLVGAVTLAVLIPAAVLVARVVAMVREPLRVAAEEATADCSHLAEHSTAATLRESA